MLSKPVRRPSPALIVAVVALVAALAGSAIALPGKNTVQSNDIKKNAVRSSDIKNDNVKGVDIKESSLGTVPSAQNSVTTSVVKTAQGKIAAGQTATVLEHGPLTVTVECGENSEPANTDLDSTAFIASSTDGTVFTSWRDGSNALGPATPKLDRALTHPTWAESSGTYESGFDGGEPFAATAASGAGIMGHIAQAAEESTNTCWYWLDARILG